jgi:hypothetical protein
MLAALSKVEPLVRALYRRLKSFVRENGKNVLFETERTKLLVSFDEFLNKIQLCLYFKFVPCLSFGFVANSRFFSLKPPNYRQIFYMSLS